MTWIKEKLGKRAQVISGYAFKSSDFLDYSKDNIPIIKIKNIKNGYVDINNDTQYVSRNKLNLDKKYIVENGDILISLTGSQITQPNSVVGRIAKCYFPNSQICLLNQRAGKFLINEDKMNRNFLFYLLTYDKYKQALALMGHGAASQANISPLQIENLEIFFPDDTKEQDKIAKILSNYDDLIENNNRRIKILEEMAQKIYKEWFVDFKFPGHETTTFKDSPLGKIPNDWEVDFVKNILIRLKSKHKYTQNNILKEGKIIVIDQSTSEYLGFHNDKPDFKANPQKPLIIFGDHTCKMQMLVEDFSIGPNVIPISSEKVPITFLYYLIDSLIETKEYKRHWNDLISKKVVLPINSLSESFSNIITPLMTMINHLKHKNMKLKQTRDILLPRLISGEINVENMEVL